MDMNFLKAVVFKRLYAKVKNRPDGPRAPDAKEVNILSYQFSLKSVHAFLCYPWKPKCDGQTNGRTQPITIAPATLPLLSMYV